MKKSLVSAALAAALVIPAAVPAFAATTPSDVVGTSVQSAVEELTALGIINGYTDGTFKPENSITRAELAKIVVIATGYDASAAAMQNVASSFKDVKTSEWYTGFINVAATKGYIQGYNGSFRPNDTVKFEEAAAILVRALGYQESKLTGSWPYNYIVAGQDADLFDDLAISTGAAANRGTVAQMASNALNAWLVEYNEDGNDYRTGEKLISKLGDTEDFVLTESALDDSEISLYNIEAVEDGDVGVDKYYDVAENFIVTGGDELVDLLGHRVTALTVDDEIVSITDAQDSGLMLETVIDGSQTDDTEITVEDGDETYDIASDAFIFLNSNRVDDVTELSDDQDVTLFLNDEDEVIAAVASAWDTNLVVEEVNEEDDYITIDTKNGDVIEVDEDTKITLNGEAADASDLEEFDIIETLISDSDDNYAVEVQATRESVAGVLESVSDDDEDLIYTIDGKDYVAASSADDLTEDELGNEYTFYLNADGEVAYYDDINVVDNSEYALIYSVAQDNYVIDGVVEENSFKIKYYSIKDGEEVTAYTTDTAFSESITDELVELEFNDDGVIEYDEISPNFEDVVGDAGVVSDEVTSTRVEVDGTRFSLNANTQYFFFDENDDEVTAAEASDLTEGDTVYVFAESGATADYVFILSDSESELDPIAGLYQGRTIKKTGSDADDFYYYAKINVNGTVETVEVSETVYNTLAGKDENTIIALDGTTSGKYSVLIGGAVKELAADAGDYETITSSSVDEDAETINGYVVTDETQIYYVDKDDLDATAKKTSFSRVEEAAKDLLKDSDADPETVSTKFQGIVVQGSGINYSGGEEAAVIVVITK